MGRWGLATWSWTPLLVLGLLALTETGRSAQEASRAGGSTDGMDEVLALERQMERAVLEADIEFLERICADDFTYSHGDGWTTGGPILGVDTRSEWLASLPGRYAARAVDSQQAEMHGDVAITMGRVQARSGGPTADQRSFSFWYVRVYAQRDGEWQYLSHRTVHGPSYEQ
ncbi:MAG: nuclear transport factor 2 family protein [Acidobacteriota bacterium]|nr:nuclear transport factor 2 family protein [Acidobacteriota bacterium]